MKPAIIGLSGLTLTPPEAEMLAAEQPAGVILFARNIIDPTQLTALIAAVRACLPEALLMVDQEGGRVARLRPPHWQVHPPARTIGELHARNAEAGLRAAWLTGALIGAQCAAAGFNLVAAPVLDVSAPDTHDVIGDRAFSADPHAVAALGAEVARGLLTAGVQPIGKHAPGHGRARADSHLELPVLADVAERDLVPFRENAWLPWLMTAHIRYTAQDMHHPATHSAPIIGGIIRAMGCNGVLTTDDLAMQALTGSPGERAHAALEAGCDIALHCSGVLTESRDVLRAIGPASAETLARLLAAREMAAAAACQSLDPASLNPASLDPASLAAERADLLA